MKEFHKNFPGLMSHHIDVTKIDRSDMEGLKIWGRASSHNMAQTLHATIEVNKYSIVVKHKTRRLLSEMKEEPTEPTQAEIQEIRDVEGRLSDSYKDVISTNRALPPKLRGRHTR